MERLVEVSEQEIRIDFTSGYKCWAIVSLRSVAAIAPIAFKVQTLSSDKFLVNPLSGLISPLSSTAFRIILRPQSELLLSFHALTQTASMISFLIEAGLKVNALVNLDYGRSISKGWTRLHVAVAFDRADNVERILRMKEVESLDCRDIEGRTPLHLEASKGHLGCVKLLHVAGAQVGARSKDSRTALFRAAANSNGQMVEVLVPIGANMSITEMDFDCSAIDVARGKGHNKVLKILNKAMQCFMQQDVESQSFLSCY